MEESRDESMILAGDIGGTKTNLGLFVEGKQRLLLKVFESFPSRESPDLESIVERFMERHPRPISSACFGIAGPVLRGRCKTTNLPWEVSEVRLARKFRFPHVRLINDLAATARAIPLLKGRELVSLNGVSGVRGGNLALVAPGTGLGEALLVFLEGRYFPLSSEGGHVDFSPTSESQVMLWRYLRKQFDHVSVERVLSGPGLVHIYSRLKDEGGTKEPVWLKKQFKEGDPARVITENALNRRHSLCARALDLFVSILGSTAGNLALVGMATGGVFLGGGIPPKILPALKGEAFMKAFVDKGRFKDFMKRIPVRVILNDKAALMGAAQWGLDVLRRTVGSKQ